MKASNGSAKASPCSGKELLRIRQRKANQLSIERSHRVVVHLMCLQSQDGDYLGVVRFGVSGRGVHDGDPKRLGREVPDCVGHLRFPSRAVSPP